MSETGDYNEGGTEMTVIGMTGDEAVAYAVKQSKTDVVAAYPITPQTIMVERFSKYVADGEVETEYVCVESEHSAMSACVGASLTGARVFTATSSQGLALMHEMLYIASGLRCPIVMGVANRALSAPINIHGDQSDMMGSRDSCWVQIYAENAQEAYDWTLQAFKVAEDKDVQLPVAVNLDGFIITHCVEGVDTLAGDAVDKFLLTRQALFKVDPEKPITIGALCFTDYYYEFKRQQVEAMRNIRGVLNKVCRDYKTVSGKSYGTLEAFGMEDAEAAIICLGSTAGTAREVARKLRAHGKKVGVVKLWLYRPFPTEEVLAALKSVKAVAVLDKAVSFGAQYGALCSDVVSALYTVKGGPKVFNVVFGLGGRDIQPADIEMVFNQALETAKTGVVKEETVFLGVRE
jgi:pyruvate ferredoxin oxidoreductase alpha subunit